MTYTLLFALSRCSAQARLVWQLAPMVYFLFIGDGWYHAMFIIGMILSERHLRTACSTVRYSSRRATITQLGCYKKVGLGMYLPDVPYTASVKSLRKNPGCFYLSYMKVGAMPDYKWFYPFWAATLVVSSVPYLRG